MERTRGAACRRVVSGGGMDPAGQAGCDAGTGKESRCVDPGIATSQQRRKSAESEQETAWQEEKNRSQNALM